MAVFAINSFRSCLSFSVSLVLVTLCFSSALADLPRVSSPPCSSFPADFSEHNRTIPIPKHHDRSMTLMDQLSFHLYSGSSFALSFSLASSNSLQEAAPMAPPALAFVLVTSLSSPPLSSVEISGMELSFKCDKENTTFSHKSHLLPICNSLPMHVLQASCNSFLVSSEEELERNSFKDEVRLGYIASSGELHVQASQYQINEKVTMTFTVSTPYAINPLPKNESTTLLVGYITSSEATINLSTSYDLPSTTPPMVVPSAPPIQKNDHYNVWIIVGTLVVATSVVGLIVLVLMMRKHYVRHCLSASSSPTRLGATPLARAPHQVSEAIGMPMMKSPSAPRYDAFQVSGTASWLEAT